MRTQDCTHTIEQRPRFPVEPALGRLWLAWLRRGLRAVPDHMLAWFERSRQRRQLGQMDDRMLRDIGISRAAASAEGQKWFWQA